MSAAKRFGRGEWVTLLAFFTWGLTMLCRTAFGYYLTELSLSSTQAGLANFLTSFCLFWSAIFFSRLAERKNCHTLILVVELAVCAVSMAALGFSRSFAMVLVVKAVLGIGCGPLFTLLMTLTERASAPDRYAGNAAIVANGESILNTILGPILIVWVLQVVGFAGTNLILAGILLILGVLWFRSRKSASGEAAAAPAAGKSVPMGQLLRSRNVIISALGGIFSLIPCWCIYVYVPSLLQKTGSYSDTAMSFVMTAMGVFMMIWMLLMPLMGKHLGYRVTGAVLSVMAIVALAALALFPDNLVCVLLFIAFGGNCSVVSMLFMAILPVESVPAEQSASAVALVNGSGELLGASVGPLIAGVLSDRLGMRFGMLFAAACMGVVLVAGLFLKKTEQKTV